jgi:glycosyltransferase involved in cell wall biosynthesis
MKLRLNYLSLFIFFLIDHHSTQCARVALCTTATGKDARSVKNLVETAKKNFLPDHKITIYVFTDQLLPINDDDVMTINWPHKRWPFSAMMRFGAYKSIASKLEQFDYVFACDVNMVFIDIIGDEVLDKTVGVLQPDEFNKIYYTSSFYGGETQEFIRLVTDCNNTIQQDLNLGIIAKLHDETHLNYHFLKNPPQLNLSPNYYYLKDNCANVHSCHNKVIALKKDLTAGHDNQIPLNDREFVILIPSYNNIQYYKKNLDSVYSQKYPTSKYRVIYIDDNSPDGTGEAVEKYVQELGKKSITTIIRNPERKLAMANIYNAIHHYCHDHEIIVMLDGDDELAGKDVLTYLNDIYKKGDTWFTYGNIWFPSLGKLGPWSKKIDDSQIELNRFREWDGAATHLRTFGAWLFKRIKKSDLQLHGKFFKMTYDVAIFMPILEMAGYHHKFIEQALYIYNDQNPISDHRINSTLQIDLDKYIRTSLEKYKPLSKLAYFEKILSQDKSLELNPIKLSAILDDLIAEIFNTYPDPMQRELALRKISFLRPNVIDQLNLLSLAVKYRYSFLEHYLSSKMI